MASTCREPTVTWASIGPFWALLMHTSARRGSRFSTHTTTNGGLVMARCMLVLLLIYYLGPVDAASPSDIRSFWPDGEASWPDGASYAALAMQLSFGPSDLRWCDRSRVSPLRTRSLNWAQRSSSGQSCRRYRSPLRRPLPAPLSLIHI